MNKKPMLALVGALFLSNFAIAGTEVKEKLSTVKEIQAKHKDVNFKKLIGMELEPKTRIIEMVADFNKDGKEDSLFIIEDSLTCGTAGCMTILKASVKPWSPEVKSKRTQYWVGSSGYSPIESGGKLIFDAKNKGVSAFSLGHLSDGNSQFEILLERPTLMPMDESHYDVMQAGASCLFKKGKETFAATDFSNVFLIVGDSPIKFNGSFEGKPIFSGKEFKNIKAQYNEKNSTLMLVSDDIDISVKVAQKCED